MKRVTLQFSNLHLLWSFARTLKVHDFKVDIKEVQLACFCDENILGEALVVYKAKVVGEVENPAL